MLFSGISCHLELTNVSYCLMKKMWIKKIHIFCGEKCELKIVVNYFQPTLNYAPHECKQICLIFCGVFDDPCIKIRVLSERGKQR